MGQVTDKGVFGQIQKRPTVRPDVGQGGDKQQQQRKDDLELALQHIVHGMRTRLLQQRTDQRAVFSAANIWENLFMFQSPCRSFFEHDHAG